MKRSLSASSVDLKKTIREYTYFEDNMTEKNKPASKQYVEIADKNGKIKIEINHFFEEAIKQLKKNAPEKLKTLREEIDEALNEETKKRIENAPKIGARFNDCYGRTWLVTGKNTLLEEPVATMRRGNSQITIRFKDFIAKDGSAKIIEEKALSENLVEVKF